MALTTYRRKRNFAVTPEPRGGKARRGGNAFVIQKHAARRLHYDLRLELDGVMKSWAVTRGPSLVPGEKRLAVATEDHPIAYNAFEGTIPEGEYGGGTVMIWDRGEWIPEGDPHKGYAKGHLEFALKGRKLGGRWHLVRMRKRAGERQESWLLIKADDAAARAAGDPDILEEKPRSVVSRRTIEGIAKAKDKVWHSNREATDRTAAPRAGKKKTPVSGKRPTAKKARKRARAALAGSEVLRAEPAARPKAAGRRAALPDFVAPSLATLAAKAPAGEAWLHEVKFDGYRMQARLDRGKVTLKTRKALDWTARFRRVADAVAALDARTALIDGEIVVEDADGISSFSTLQADLRDGREDRFAYYVFDLLHLDGRDLRALPLAERKAALEALLRRSDPNAVVRYSAHFAEDGAVMLHHACKHQLEGVLSKLREAPYRSGRNDAWIKTKCAQSQEFVVTGYADSTAMPRAIGSLVLGFHEDGALHYAGRVGTGYSGETAHDLWERLQPLRTDKPPFRLPAEERGRKARWVAPKLVAEVDFRGWTGARRVRQASFKGLREDKPAREIVRETPMTKAPKAAKRAARKAPAKRAKSKSGKAAVIAGSEVRFSNPDRIYWTDVEITKQDLARYYETVWERMAPHVVRRPLALVRCPSGVGGQCFFQKHATAGLTGAHLEGVRDRRGEELIYIDDLDGLLSLVQAGVLEVHHWGSTVDHVETCDRMVFDLDPGDGVGWSDVVHGARELRERLQALGLESFLKTSGGKGLHVVVPFAGADWDTTKAFTQAVVQMMAADAPKRYVAKMTKSLRKGRIFIDYLRNGRGATAVAAYSTRARPGASVSMPIAWDELGPKMSPNKFTVRNTARRLSQQRKDPWADIAKVRQQLPDAVFGRR